MKPKGTKHLKYKGKTTKYYINKNGDVFNKHGDPIKPFLSSSGYLMVSVQINGIRKHMYIHRAVAETFIATIPDNMEVNHINRDKLDNNVFNLEIVTHHENIDHFWESKKGKEETKIIGRYSEDTIRDICMMLQDNYLIKEIASKLNIPKHIISYVKSRKYWTDISKDYDLHPTNKHRYTKEEDMIIISMMNNGQSYEEIAKKLNVDKKSIKNRFFHEHLKDKEIKENPDYTKIIQNFRSQGKTDEEIIELLNTENLKNKYANIVYHVYSEEDELISKMIELGFTYKNIAKALHVSYGSIKAKAKRLRNKR